MSKEMLKGPSSVKKIRDWVVALTIETTIIGLLMFGGAYLLIAALHKTFFNPWG